MYVSLFEKIVIVAKLILLRAASRHIPHLLHQNTNKYTNQPRTHHTHTYYGYNSHDI